MSIRRSPGAGPPRRASFGVVSAPSAAPSLAPVAERQRARPGHSIASLRLPGLYYLVAAVAVTMWLWRDPASRLVAANPYDSDQFAWFFRYDATAVAHLRLPALSTAGMNAPQGVNLMWNTPMLLPGVLLAPLTLLAGPQASITVLLTAGFAGSALAMFAVTRRWGASGQAAAAAGLVYGFSPALVQSAQGHDDLQFALLPPLVIDAVLRLATGRCGPGRRAAARSGAWLGLLAAAQIFISEELLFDSAVAAAIAVTVLAAGGRPRPPGRPPGPRPRGRRRRCRRRLRADHRLSAVGAVLRTHPAARQPLPARLLQKRPGRVCAPVRRAAAAHSRQRHVRGGLPGRPSGVSGVSRLADARHPRGGDGAVLATATGPHRGGHVRAARGALAGGTLLAGGHEHPSVTLPWYWLQTLPIAGSVVPDRFSILADGAAAALLAFAIDAARARWTAQRWPQARAVIAVIVVAAIAPLVPRPLAAGSGPPVPAGWTATFSALRLPAGAHVLVLPIPVSTFTEPLRWEADTGVPSSMYGGYFMGPGRQRPGGHRWQRAVARGPVPEPAVGAVTGRRHRSGRRPAWSRHRSDPRADEGPVRGLEPGRRRRRHRR